MLARGVPEGETVMDNLKLLAGAIVGTGEEQDGMLAGASCATLAVLLCVFAHVASRHK